MCVMHLLCRVGSGWELIFFSFGLQAISSIWRPLAFLSTCLGNDSLRATSGGNHKKSPQRCPPWARRSNQSILKEISPGCSLEGLILKLKLQYFGPHLAMTGASHGFSRAAAPVWGFSRYMMGSSGSLSCGARCASSAKTRGFHTQLDEGPESLSLMLSCPGAAREAP